MILLQRFILIVAFVTAFAISSVEARLSSQDTPQTETYQAQPLYEALAAEIYRQLGEEKLAVIHYQRLIVLTDDPAVAKRVTKLAATTGQLVKGLETAKHWVGLSPDSLEARQYLALLYLRNNQLKASAEQLNTIYQLVAKSSDKAVEEKYKRTIANSKSLKFIGSLLAAESHHDKSHQVFGLYLKQFGDKKYNKQQQLISADLAMKAKKYSAVLVSLESLDGLDSHNLVDASAMKAKALYKLNQTTKAIKVLESIKNRKETMDSHRLELVRLLVLVKQKDKALPILEKLTDKHHKNNDLLKSLIALQIDQSLLQKARTNIQKLRLIDNYRNDADYFSGEVFEAQRRFDKALQSYKKVTGGSFLKNAHKKTIRFTKQVNGQIALNKFFSQKQKKSNKVRDKAYWSKLQADSFFDAKKYNEAMDLYNKAIALSPGNTLYYYHRGLLNERMGKLDTAESDFNFVINKRKNDADALNALGYMLSVNTQRLDEAKNYIKKAYTIKPNDPVIMDSLGFVLFKTGDLSLAERYLRKAFRLIKSPEVASHLISVLAGSDQHQEAQNIFDEMNKKYPNSRILKNVKRVLQVD